MKVLVVIDSFKGSASSSELAEATRQGIREASADIVVQIAPISDGGEGLTEAFSALEHTIRHNVRCQDPLGRDITSSYLIVDQHTAVIESAQACGLTLLTDAERDPLKTSSYGLGEMIRDALNHGIRDFIIGLGGSVTNDAGLGMLRALGYQFFNQYGEEVTLVNDLHTIEKIDLSTVDKRVGDSHFVVASDVHNPLYGSHGASVVYAEQKGADPETVVLLEQELQYFASLISELLDHDHADTPGAGAAGGLGFAFASFLNAELRSGIEVLTEKLKIEEKIAASDIVITGEGRVDEQSSMGKVISGISELCQKHHTQCLVFSGDTQAYDPVLYRQGVTAIFSIQDSPRSREEAMQKETTLKLIQKLSEQLFRTFNFFGTKPI